MTDTVLMRLIYGAIDSDTREMRYVGQTTAPLNKRSAAHVALSRRKNWPLHRLIRKRVAEGRAIEWVEIEYLDDQDTRSLDDLEIGWITFFRELGCNLLNCTAGGAGFRDFKRTAEHKARISSSMKIACSTTEARRRLGDIHRGKPRSAETKAKLSTKLKGRALPGRPKKIRSQGDQ